MSESFSQPPPANPKIAAPVDLAAVDAERQKLYGPLVEANEQFKKEPSTPVVPDSRRAPPKAVDLSGQLLAPAEPEISPLIQPTEDDKKSFLATILGGKRYQKTYILFGAVTVLMVDRSAEEAQAIFDELAARERAGTIKESDWDLWRERFQLAYQMRELRHTEGVQSFAAITIKELDARLKELLALPKPLYQAVMEVGRVFDAHTDLLTETALDAGFWKPGARDSRSTPPARAR